MLEEIPEVRRRSDIKARIDKIKGKVSKGNKDNGDINKNNNDSP
jgi:hypothetical protein